MVKKMNINSLLGEGELKTHPLLGVGDLKMPDGPEVYLTERKGPDYGNSVKGYKVRSQNYPNPFN